jgi:signal transduction histidine kinase
MAPSTATAPGTTSPAGTGAGGGSPGRSPVGTGAGGGSPGRRTPRPRHSLLRQLALVFVAAVLVTALALSLAAYFITKAGQEDEALQKALDQSGFNLFLADSMLPAQPEGADFDRLIDAFKIRGDFATLIEAGSQTYFSGLDVNRTLVTPELAAKVAEGHIGYQNITAPQGLMLVVGGPVRSGELSIYFFFPQGERLAELARLRNILTIAGAILTALGAIVGYLLARALVRPIRRTTKAAVQMSHGDLDIRLPERSDEFGVLASSFNRMAGNLQSKMLALEAGQARERRFVADVAHELRTPVSALVGEASLLKTRLATDPAAASSEISQLVTMMNADITRLRQLVDDLLEISRLEAQAAETVMEPVELGTFLGQLVRARDWSETVRLSIPDQALWVQADRRRVERIIVNLVENALKHGAAPVAVEARVARESEPGELMEPGELAWPAKPGELAENSLVQVAVTDNGPGIPVEHLPHIFDRFYKADPSRSSSRGSGLGLAIARENARLLGGDITAGNAPGGGARFVLTLPASQL